MTIQAGSLEQLRAENARLAALLDAHGIGWREPISAPAAGFKSLRLLAVDAGQSVNVVTDQWGIWSTVLTPES